MDLEQTRRIAEAASALGFCIRLHVDELALLGGAAWALERADRIGSLEPGKQADLVILDAPSYQHLAYGLGTAPIAAVVKSGRVVAGDTGDRVGKMGS